MDILLKQDALPVGVRSLLKIGEYEIEKNSYNFYLEDKKSIFGIDIKKIWCWAVHTISYVWMDQ